MVLKESGNQFVANTLCLASKVESSLALILTELIFASAREGHLCLAIEEIKDSPFFSSLSENGKELLLEWLSSANKALPSPLFSYLQENDEILKGPIGIFKNHFYLHRNWVFESTFVFELKKFLLREEERKEDRGNLHGSLLECNEEQKEAIIHGLTAPFLMITGGPGTGKTFVAKEILKLLHAKGGKEKILVCAPTGKAVANIKKSIGKALDTNQITFSTLHSALKIKNFEELSPSRFFLNADLVIVDECSMIDMKVFTKLFQSLHRKSRLILLGDPHQLPPVDVGTAFYDMSKIAGLKKVCLKTCIRAESESIINFALSIMNSKESLQDKEEVEPLQNFSLEPFAALAKNIACSPLDFATLEKAFSEHKILCSHNIGPYGTEKINESILQYILKNSEKNSHIALPVIMNRSLSKYELMNGEQGLLIKNLTDSTEDTLVFESKEGYQTIRAKFIADYSLGFALSIHKSQGSEYNHVYILCADESEMMSKELLYTAITRARKSAKLFASPLTFKKALLKSAMKRSQIISRV